MDNKIIIICLPSHTTHALQPCDVGAFGPLTQSWKQVVTIASQSLIAIRKDNLLQHYHNACIMALKPTTIQSAFRKTGIWPLNHHAIPLSAFEPAKNTTTQAAQPLPAHLPSLLVPTPTPTPIPTPTPSVAATAALHSDAETPAQGPVELLPDKEDEPMQRYHIDVAPPLLGTASWQALRAENMMLRDIIKQASVALEEDYTQMKLMDLENERLRKQVLEKGKRKTNSKLASGRARHMTAAENLDLLARQDWESRMKDVLKEAAPRFRVLKKDIVDYHKVLEKARKVAEQEARWAAAAAARARGCGTGNRGGRRGRGRGTRARGRGRGVPMAGVNVEDSDSGSEPFAITESSKSGSSSNSTSEEEIPIPRSRRPRPVRVIRANREPAAEEESDQPPPRPRAHAREPTAEEESDQPPEDIQPPPRPRPRPRARAREPTAEGESDQPPEDIQPPPRPCPHPHAHARPQMPNHLPEGQGLGEDRDADVSESGGIDAAVGDGLGTLQHEGGQRHTIGHEVGIDLVLGISEGGLVAQEGGIGVPAKVQSRDVDTQVGPSRRRNPRRGNQLDTTTT